MTRKTLFYSLVIIAGIIAVMFGVVLFDSASTENIAIWDNTPKAFNIIYFASLNGRWIETTDTVKPHHVHNAQMIASNPFLPAHYKVAIGDKLGKFYCTAELERSGVSGKLHFVHHKGHYQTYRVKDGQLALIINAEHPIH